MRWRLAGIAILVAVLLAYLVRPVILAEMRWRDIQRRGVLRIGIDPGRQPFSYYTAQGWQGSDAELAKALGQRLNLSIQSDPVGYDAMADALQTGRTDIGLSALVADPTRTEDLAYTHSYFDAGPRLLTGQSITGFEDLANQRVAVMLGSDADRLLRFWMRRVPGLQAVTFNSDAAGVAALESQQVNAALVDVLALPKDAETHWHVLSPQPRPFVIAVRRDSTRLLQELNRALDETEKR